MPPVILGDKVKHERIILYLALLLVLAIIATSLIYFNTRRHRAVPLPLPAIVENKPKLINIGSPAIKNGSLIPVRYTCDGAGTSPPLVISSIPPSVRELVLVMYDPDAPGGVFYHWLLYNIPASARVVIPEALPPVPIIKGLGAQGVNSYGRIGYGPPCPPRGSKHRYIFLVLGLDAKIQLPPAMKPKELFKAIAGHVVTYGILYGVYKR